jgi:YegS/Rv2252/BmrU family lipid kinase
VVQRSGCGGGFDAGIVEGGILPGFMLLIVNPMAGGYRAGRWLPALRKWAAKQGGVQTLVTSGPAEVQQTSPELWGLKDGKLIVAGGDGTVRSVLPLCLSSGCRLGILAGGTGNDVARSLGLPLWNLSRALRVVEEDSVRSVDVGMVGGQLFLSVLGLGFPAVVAAAAVNTPPARGPLPFFFAILRSLGAWQPTDVEIRFDRERLTEGIAAVLIQNTPFTGGGMHTLPSARMDDGMLDLLVAYWVPPKTLIGHLLKLYSGRHLSLPFFERYQVRSLEIHSQHPIPATVDGDPFLCTSESVCISPKRVTVLVK